MTDDLSKFDMLRALKEQGRRIGQTEVKEVPGGFGIGTAFPASPASGARFFRSDLGWLCYFDGTRWLTTFELVYVLNPITVAANGNQLIAPIRTDFAPYITRVAVGWVVAAPNDANNYWAYLLRGVSATYAAATNIHSDNTSGGTAGTWSIGNAAPSATATPANNAALDISYSKAGAGAAPGNLTISAALYSRLIVT